MARFRARVQATEGEVLARVEATRLARFARGYRAKAEEGWESLDGQSEGEEEAFGENNAVQTEGSGVDFDGKAGLDVTGGLRSDTEALAGASTAGTGTESGGERKEAERSRGESQNVSGPHARGPNSERASIRTMSRQKSGSRGRPQERRASLGRRPSRGGEALRSDVAADLIDRAGKVSADVLGCLLARSRLFANRP